MAAILLRSIPEDIRRRLKARAKANRRSMAREVVSILEQVFNHAPNRPPLNVIDALRIKGRAPLTQELLDKARREGRMSLAHS